MTATERPAVDPAWVARELAKAPKSMTQAQQHRIRSVVLGARRSVSPDETPDERNSREALLRLRDGGAA